MATWEELAELSPEELRDIVYGQGAGIRGQDILEHEIEEMEGVILLQCYVMLVLNEESDSEVRWEHFLSVLKCADVPHVHRFDAFEKFMRRDQSIARDELISWIRDSTGLTANDTATLKLRVAVSLGDDYADEFVQRVQWSMDY